MICALVLKVNADFVELLRVSANVIKRAITAMEVGRPCRGLKGGRTAACVTPFGSCHGSARLDFPTGLGEDLCVGK